MDTCKSTVWGAEPDDVRQCTRPAAWDGYCSQHHPQSMMRASAAAVARKPYERRNTDEKQSDSGGNPVSVGTQYV